MNCGLDSTPPPTPVPAAWNSGGTMQPRRGQQPAPYLQRAVHRILLNTNWRRTGRKRRVQACSVYGHSCFSPVAYISPNIPHLPRAWLASRRRDYTTRTYCCLYFFCTHTHTHAHHYRAHFTHTHTHTHRTARLHRTRTATPQACLPDLPRLRLLPFLPSNSGANTLRLLLPAATWLYYVGQIISMLRRTTRRSFSCLSMDQYPHRAALTARAAAATPLDKTHRLRAHTQR